MNPLNPVEYDLSETFQFLRLLESLGVRLVNLSAGSPYYNPHIQRPAIYPPSDGYQPPEDPLVGVARQINVVKQLKARFPNLILVGTGYSYLQEYLPHVAEHYVRNGHVDIVGIGRAVLSYPTMLADATSKENCRRVTCAGPSAIAQRRRATGCGRGVIHWTTSTRSSKTLPSSRRSRSPEAGEPGKGGAEIPVRADLARVQRADKNPRAPSHGLAASWLHRGNVPCATEGRQRVVRGSRRQAAAVPGNQPDYGFASR